MDRVLKYGFFYLLVTLLSVKGYAQSFTITTNKDSILIGEPLYLTLSLNKENQQDVIWPLLKKGDSLPDYFEVLETLPIQSANNNANIKSQQITITSFEPGEHDLLPLIVQDKNGVISSNSLKIKVKLVEVDTTKSIIDIVPVKEPELTFNDRLKLLWKWIKRNWIIILVIVVVLAILIFLLTRKKKQKPATEEPVIVKPTIPPHTKALQAIEKLVALNLLEKNETKQHYVGLTQIIDQYLEGSYNISTEDKTSKEIIALVNEYLTQEEKEKLIEIFETADLVKFAKQKPSNETNAKLIESTITFIRSTSNKNT